MITPQSYSKLFSGVNVMIKNHHDHVNSAKPFKTAISGFYIYIDKRNHHVLLEFSLTVKATPHECVIRTNQP